MATQETPEAFIEDLGVRLRANGGTDKGPALCNVLPIAADNVCSNVVDIGHTATKKVWTWFADEVLDALGDHESQCKTQTQAHPPGIKLP